jgi:hypothetical protein
MEPQAKIDVKELEHRIGKLQKNLAFLGQGPSVEASELFTIIHRPGWTTLPEVAVATQLLDAMNQQAVAMQSLRDALKEHVKASGGQAEK